MMTKRVRTYSEMRRLNTFEERFEYLKLNGSVGRSTFGYDRYINQKFYTSREWRNLRHQIIVRDNGMDLGIEDHEISGSVLIHHMNPITAEHIQHNDPDILNPEFLITVSHNTHNAIHFGDASLLPRPFVERRPGDTILW